MEDHGACANDKMEAGNRNSARQRLQLQKIRFLCAQQGARTTLRKYFRKVWELVFGWLYGSHLLQAMLGRIFCAWAE